MTQFLALAGFGFLLGMRHATDADHVIAVTTILNRSRRFAHTTLIGLLWGLGHTVTVIVVGMAIIVFNVVIPPAVGLAMEFAVAIMLIVLGILNLTGGLRQLTERVTPPAPMHGHPHDISTHTTKRSSSTSIATRICTATGPMSGLGLLETFGWYQLVRPVAVGLIHGLAGSAAVALLVLATIEDTGAALGYLVIFCVGVAAGMAVLTTVIGLPFWVASTRSAQINRWLMIASGVLSLAFGFYLAYQIGVVDGLFTGDFHWDPA